MQSRCVDRVQAAEPKWGVLYFAYDWFSAIRTDMVREVKCASLPQSPRAPSASPQHSHVNEGADFAGLTPLHADCAALHNSVLTLCLKTSSVTHCPECFQG